MPFEKQGDRVDIHIWLSERHVAVLDRLARQFELSRAKVIAGLIYDYAKGENRGENRDR